MWNKDTRARYRICEKAPLPMTAVAFADDASLLAFAFGEDWSMGAEHAKKRQNQPKIWVRKCEQQDVWKPKKI